MMTSPRVQTIVHNISKEYHRRFGNKATLIWFGSWVKGTAYQQSDIDLAIEHHGKLTQKEIVEFQDWLDDFPTLYSIDLIEMQVASEALKQDIKRYGKIVMNKKSKLNSFNKAIENLRTILLETETQIVRDAAIKRYELCYELAWKSIQEALKAEGLEICKSPKSCFKQAFQQGWINEEDICLEMISSRNQTTHTYNEELAQEIYNNLKKYLPLFEFLLVRLQTIEL